MPKTELDVSDLSPWVENLNPAKAGPIVAEVLEEAAAVAPGIFADDFTRSVTAKGVLRSAALRRYEATRRGRTQVSQAAGPHTITETVDTSKVSDDILTSIEMLKLQQLAGTPAASAGAAALPQACFPPPDLLPRDLW